MSAISGNQTQHSEQRMIWILSAAGLCLAVLAWYSWSYTPKWRPKVHGPGSRVNLSMGSFDLFINTLLSRLLTQESVISVISPVKLTSALLFNQIQLLGLDSLKLDGTTDLVAHMSKETEFHDTQPLRYDISFCLKADDLNVKAIMNSWLPFHSEGPVSLKILPVKISINVSIFIDEAELEEFDNKEGLNSVKPKGHDTSGALPFAMRMTEFSFVKWSGLQIVAGDEGGSYSQKLLSWLTNGAAWVTSLAFMGTVESEITRILNKELATSKRQLRPLFTHAPHQKSSISSLSFAETPLEPKKSFKNKTDNTPLGQDSGISKIVSGPLFGLVNTAVQETGHLNSVPSDTKSSSSTELSQLNTSNKKGPSLRRRRRIHSSGQLNI